MEKTTNKQNEQREEYMLDTEYMEWINEYWGENAGLMTQAQAAQLLGKTPTRIRQMINEKKLEAFTYKNNSPLVSFAQIRKIYKLERQKTEDEFMTYHNEDNHINIIDEEIESEKYREEDKKGEKVNEYRKELEERYRKLQKRKEKIEEEMAKLQLAEKQADIFFF